MNDILFGIIVFITSVSTVVLVLEASGFLPMKIKKYLIKNKMSDTLAVLEELAKLRVNLHSIIKTPQIRE